MTLFQFSLRALGEVEPWGEPDAPTLHWFGLSAGTYHMEVGQTDLLAYSAVAQSNGADAVCTYPVARLIEDLTEMLPFVLEPVPAELSVYIQTAVRAAHTDDAIADENDQHCATRTLATGWISRRTLDTGYLHPSARIAMWSDTERVSVAWNNRDKVFAGVQAWSAIEGTFELPRALFVDEVTNFHTRLMAAMAERIDRVTAGDLSPTIGIDAAGLRRDHTTHCRSLEAAFKSPLSPPRWDDIVAACNDWDKIRSRR